MNTRLFYGVTALTMLLTLGWGCTKNPEPPLLPLEGGSEVPEVRGANDTLPDGKGALPFELCVSTEEGVTGAVSLSAANNTEPRKDWSQWFSKTQVAEGDASREICGPLNFALESGDKVYLNGSWSNGKRFLVDNRGVGATAHDDIKEIWIDDQFYEIGKDCAYQSNGVKGYDLVCTVR